jgi:hypothetical protein
MRAKKEIQIVEKKQELKLVHDKKPQKIPLSCRYCELKMDQYRDIW